jgi:hypothetical protein
MEHLEHAIRHEKPADYVDGRESDGQEPQYRSSGAMPAPGHHQRSDDGDAVIGMTSSAISPILLPASMKLFR